MRFESVNAYAFGPFRDQTLDLAPGMNVVYGPNEAGKSTWHAALYAGLCGMRRGRGQPRAEDREFRERHGPWDGGGWEVGAVIALADGRRVELRHDLAGGVDSSARDVDIADRDYSNEIVNEGAPDGSRWLGLDRRSFLSTACVRQAQVLAVRDGAADLQDELQRAATTAGTDETAADALRLLRDYRAERVGTERAPTRPLVRSRSAVTDAQRALDAAQRAHGEYLQRSGAIDQLERNVEAREQEAAAVRAVLAARVADEAEARRDKAQLLSARFPGGPPARPSEEANLTQQVAAALTLWSERPTPQEPEGEPIDELERQLAELDLQLAVVAEADASRAEEQLERARDLSALFPEGGLQLPSEDDELVRRVEAALTRWNDRPAAHDPGGEPVWVLEERVEKIDRELAQAKTHQHGTGGLAGLLRAIVNALARLWRAFTGQRAPSTALPDNAVEALRERRVLLRNQIDIRTEEERRAQNITEQREMAAETVRQAAVAAGSNVTTPEDQVRALRDWQVNRKNEVEEADRKRRDWDALQQLLGQRTLEEVAAEAGRMRDEADERAGSVPPAALAEALERPLASEALHTLRHRATPERRTRIEHRTANRKQADRAYAEDSKRLNEAASALREAARATGSDASEPDAQLAAIGRWEERRQEEMAEADSQREDWEELQRLLGEKQLDELEAETERLRNDAEVRAANLDPSALVAARDQKPDRALLDDLEQQADRARAERDTKQGELAEFEQTLPDVAGVEEALAAAERERSRVERLNQTLGTTIEFLERAQERVHRNIAPVLRRTLLEWLPRVTGGRYSDCQVNPQSLAVDVLDRDGHWRPAGLLSHGTTEQVYLLLRLALAHHLVKPGEACPLILDDAVAASDASRTREVLNTLLAISESVQVVLFTHEDNVREWAEERLSGERDHLTLLEPNGARG